MKCLLESGVMVRQCNIISLCNNSSRYTGIVGDTLQRIGELQTAIQVALLDGFRPAWLEHKVMNEAEYEDFRAEVAEVVADPSLELVAPYWYAWGKKTVTQSND